MPPIELKAFGDVQGPIFGTDFGLFAMKPIKKHIFLG